MGEHIQTLGHDRVPSSEQQDHALPPSEHAKRSPDPSMPKCDPCSEDCELHFQFRAMSGAIVAETMWPDVCLVQGRSLEDEVKARLVEENRICTSQGLRLVGVGSRASPGSATIWRYCHKDAMKVVKRRLRGKQDPRYVVLRHVCLA